MIKIFVLSSGRSGTNYLSELFKYNVKNCVAKHESYLSLFGKPIYWYQEGEIEKIRKLFIFKKNIINSYKADVYIETNHAFLKSFSELAMEFFPDMKLIHMIRNPLEVTKSQYNRFVSVGEPELFILRTPFFSYSGSDGKRYFKWSLTGKERIFREIDIELTKYQRLLMQWIEIENRAMNFLEKYNKHDDCFTVETPKDLNNKEKINDMFRFFGVESKTGEIVFRGRKNIAKIPTAVTSDDKKELLELVNHIPDRYLKIFQEEPYIQFEWASMLVKH